MPAPEIAQYHAAYLALLAAERRGNDTARNIQEFAKQLQDWKKMKVPGPGGTTIAPPGALSSAEVVDPNKWPTAEGYLDAVRAYHNAVKAALGAWARLTPTEREAFQPPPA